MKKIMNNEEEINIIVKRINNNEKRLNNLLTIIRKLNIDLFDFEKCISDYRLLNEYYGSKEWFNDKELYEKSIIPKINAGVLSEDAVWNMNEDIHELIQHINKLIEEVNIMEKEKCNCGPDCTCGCQEGKECTCNDEKCGCDDNCTCGCQEEK